MIICNCLSGREPSGAARRGSGLLTGVLRCRRCARMLRVCYKGPDGEVVRCACSKAHLDNKEARCVAFSGAIVDGAVAMQLLRVVRPAAMEAAIMATQQTGASTFGTRDPRPELPSNLTWLQPLQESLRAVTALVVLCEKVIHTHY